MHESVDAESARWSESRSSSPQSLSPRRLSPSGCSRAPFRSSRCNRRSRVTLLWRAPTRSSRAHDLAHRREEGRSFQLERFADDVCRVGRRRPDSLDALVHGRDIAPFRWSVRAFIPGNPREARVDLHPTAASLVFQDAGGNGQATRGQCGFRPTSRAASAGRVGRRSHRPLAARHDVVRDEENERPDRSHVHVRASRSAGGRSADSRRRRDCRRHAGESAIVRRHSRVVRAALQRDAIRERSPRASRERRHARHRHCGNHFPEPSRARPGRSLAPAVADRSRHRRARLAAGLNEMPGSWYGYDTASPASFQAILLLGALAIGGITTVLVGFTLAAAEARLDARFHSISTGGSCGSFAARERSRRGSLVATRRHASPSPTSPSSIW